MLYLDWSRDHSSLLLTGRHDKNNCCCLMTDCELFKWSTDGPVGVVQMGANYAPFSFNRTVCKMIENEEQQSKICNLLYRGQLDTFSAHSLSSALANICWRATIHAPQSELELHCDWTWFFTRLGVRWGRFRNLRMTNENGLWIIHEPPIVFHFSSANLGWCFSVAVRWITKRGIYSDSVHSLGDNYAKSSPLCDWISSS